MAAKPSLRDPHCGNIVNIRKAVMEYRGRQIYYFCSEECRRRFDQELST